MDKIWCDKEGYWQYLVVCEKKCKKKCKEYLPKTSQGQSTKEAEKPFARRKSAQCRNT